MLQVLDLRATINRDGRREPFIEKLALIVTDDDHRLGSGFLELLRERFHGLVTLRKTLAPGLHRYFGAKTWGSLPQQRFIVVGLSAIKMLLVFAIDLCSKIPLLGRSGEQRTVRRSDAKNDFCHRVQST